MTKREIKTVYNQYKSDIGYSHAIKTIILMTMPEIGKERLDKLSANINYFHYLKALPKK